MFLLVRPQLQQFMPYDYIPVDIKTEPFMPETGERSGRRHVKLWSRSQLVFPP